MSPEERADKAERKLSDAYIDGALETAAEIFEIPSIALKLVDRSRVRYDPDRDEVTGVAEAIRDVIQAHPGIRRGGKGTPQRDQLPLHPAPDQNDRRGPQIVDARLEMLKLGGYGF